MMMENVDNHSSIEFNVEFKDSFIKKIVFQGLKPFIYIFILSPILFILICSFLYWDAHTHAYSLLLSFKNVYQTVIILPTLLIILLNALCFFSLYGFMYGNTNDYYKKLGKYQQVSLTGNHFIYRWGEKIYSKISWDFFVMLKRSPVCWQLVLFKNQVIYLPTDQLPPEAQAFILQKLTEHNVPIKG